MQQTNGVTAVISQEQQSDLVTSAIAAGGGQKDPIKNGKSVVIASNPASKTKITTLITAANNSKSSSNPTNINNNNSTTTNKNNSGNKSVPNGRADVIVTNLQHKLNNNNASKKNAAISEATPNQPSSDANGNGKTSATAPLPDVRAKQVLKEAVDAVVNSFTKHTQGYGRGEFINLNINLYFRQPN